MINNNALGIVTVETYHCNVRYKLHDSYVSSQVLYVRKQATRPVLTK